MGWLQRLFGIDKPAKRSQQTQQNKGTTTTVAAPSEKDASIPLERVGLDGEYDQSGLAKRVALAFDEDSNLDDIDTLYVAQTNSTVVLKGKVPSQETLNKMVSVAKGVKGATAVDTEQVTIG
ncbi:MAG: phospholipid-binding protein [Cyanobacteria bacterium CRU_2_1]|nr:phospholipid-binding protein [Cyanobacteria bacterium RU_5_0]NJR58791.1 phospholipid-binding protein [Cyanobacteria bacterium CRU_2_1]